MAQYDPTDHDAHEVIKHLDTVEDAAERTRLGLLELAGKKRKTVLEALGLDPEGRYDDTGRQMYPWEVTGDDMADANRVVEEADDARERREAELKQQEQIAAARAPQGGSTSADSGTAAAGTASTASGSASTGSAGTATAS